jgi:hypothetical protein
VREVPTDRAPHERLLTVADVRTPARLRAGVDTHVHMARRGSKRTSARIM